MKEKCEELFGIWLKWQSETSVHRERLPSDVVIALNHITTCPACLRRTCELTAEIMPGPDKLGSEAPTAANKTIKQSRKAGVVPRERNIAHFLQIERASGFKEACRQLPSIAVELATNPDAFDRYYLYRELLSPAKQRKGDKLKFHGVAEAVETKIKNLKIKIQQDIETVYTHFCEGLMPMQPAAATATRSLEEQLSILGRDSAMATESDRKARSDTWIGVVVPLAAEILADIGASYERSFFEKKLQEALNQPSAQDSLRVSLVRGGASNPALSAQLLTELAIQNPDLIMKHVDEIALRGWITLDDNLKAALETARKNTG